MAQTNTEETDIAKRGTEIMYFDTYSDESLKNCLGYTDEKISTLRSDAAYIREKLQELN